MGTCTCSMPIPLRAGNGEVAAWCCSQCGLALPVSDPRDAEIAALKARAEKAEAELLKWESGEAEREMEVHYSQALAACAELRAALEAVATANTRRLGESRRAIEAARAFLARPDLGAGKVLVGSGTLERCRQTAYQCGNEVLVADIDALLKKGGG